MTKSDFKKQQAQEVKDFYERYPDLQADSHSEITRSHSVTLISQALYVIYLASLSCSPLLSRSVGVRRRTINKLISLGYLVEINQHLEITDNGHYYINSCIDRPEYCPPNSAAWFREATSRTKADGSESKFVNITIPGKSVIIPFSDPNEKLVEIALIIKKLAKRLNITIQDALTAFADERVAHCPNCRNLSIFHLDSRSKSGLKTICKNCRS